MKCWYKRYTGTIAGLPVVVNLLFYYTKEKNKDNYVESLYVKGNYLYSNKSGIIDLIQDQTGLDENTKIHLFESIETVNGRNEYSERPEWVISVDSNIITGKWKDYDKSTTYDIMLYENYDGGFPFDIVLAKDSVKFLSQSEVYWMKSEYIFMKPTSQMNEVDAIFVERSIVEALNSDDTSFATIKSFTKYWNNKLFKAYSDSLKTFGEVQFQEGEHNNWLTSIKCYCRNNNNGFLSFYLLWEDVVDGHVKTRCHSRISLDVLKRKKIDLHDVFIADTSQELTSLINSIAKDNGMFYMPDDISLDDTAQVDKISASPTFIISDYGITFYYDPYNTWLSNDESLSLFIPFFKVKELLKPEFKKRMNL